VPSNNYQSIGSLPHSLSSPHEDSNTGKDPRSNTPLQRDGRLSASPHPHARKFVVIPVVFLPQIYHFH